jgi:hypothetical protein
MTSYTYWRNLALGSRWEEGIVGGTLLHAIDTDKIDLSEEFQMEAHDGGAANTGGVSIQNLISSHNDYGNTRTWY